MKEGNKFKKGDLVEARDEKYHGWQRGVYLTYNDLEDCTYPHVVQRDGFNEAISYYYCRHCKPDLKVDDPVWVKNVIDGKWQPRHFCKWEDNECIITFMDGKTSHTNIGPYSISTWNYYTTEDPNKKE